MDDGEIVEAPVAVEPVPMAEPMAEPAPVPAEPAKAPWYMDRIAKESARARENEERATAAEKRAQDAEALAARLRVAAGGEGVVAATSAVAPMAESEAQRRAAIQQEAQTQRFFEDTLEVRHRGEAAYGAKFTEVLNILGALGATTNDFIADVLAIDKSNAHAMLEKLSKDPEKAASLTGMTSRQRIAELTRMSLATEKPAVAEAAATPVPKTTSKAPPPPPVVQPSASKTVNWRTDEASDEEFDAGFKEMLQKRNARR